MLASHETQAASRQREANPEDEIFLSDPQVRKRWGMSRTTFWRQSKQPDFPPPYELQGRGKHRKLSEIAAHEERRRKPRAA
jgi:predicted DNA-binding transcriptional regulator AlpA